MGMREGDVESVKRFEHFSDVRHQADVGVKIERPFETRLM
jgi:hypothetical protein